MAQMVLVVEGALSLETPSWPWVAGSGTDRGGLELEDPGGRGSSRSATLRKACILTSRILMYIYIYIVCVYVYLCIFLHTSTYICV